jgi:hypothetical protein
VQSTSRTASRIDRTRDLANWLTVPFVTLIAGPLLAVCTGVVLTLLSHAGVSSLTENACTSTEGNVGLDCYAAETALIQRHLAAFLIGWLLLWCLPWWRGLRRARLLIAALSVLPLVLLPLEMLQLHTPDG